MAATTVRGFTLLEVLAVVLLTSLVIGVALDFYVDLSRAAIHATERTRGLRRATAIVDRVARDLESAILIEKPPETDPLEHPWIFYGEARISETGADHLKFVTRSHEPRRSATHESDLAMVAYSVRRAETGSLELMRWTMPRLPEGLERNLARDEADGAVLLADGLKEFSVTFIDSSGNREDNWDSSLLLRSGELPVAAVIEVALMDAADTPAIHRARRRVLLPVRPLDLEELLDPTSAVSGGTQDGEGDEVDEDGVALAGEGTPDCLDGPCGNMTICQAIGCASKVGRYGSSIDTLLDDLLGQDVGFCGYKRTLPRSLRWLINNPACR